MKITLIAPGKVKDQYMREGIADYSKRLSRFVEFRIIEVADEGAGDNLSPLEMEKIKQKEGKAILNKIPAGAFVIALDRLGQRKDSIAMADFIDKKAVEGTSHFAFIIGGSLGLSDEVLKLAGLKLTFGDFTYPHQLMRLIFTEQLYRWFKIIKNESYHK